MSNLPNDMQTFLVGSSPGGFKAERYYVRESESAIVDDIIKMKYVADIMSLRDIPYKNTTLLYGESGTGKTELALKFSNASKENKFCDGYVLTTATSDWSTFDTIGGLMPDENGELYFNQGKFLEAIALNKWLIIDEINRADIDKAFGQLFTVLSGQNVELPYKLNGKSVKIAYWEENRCKYDP